MSQGSQERRAPSKIRPDAGFIERFERVARLPLRRASKAALPALLRGRPSPSPSQLLAVPGLSRRTVNVLERWTSRPAASRGAWTYDRLLGIPGFGMVALLDVLEAWDAQRRQDDPLRVAVAPLEEEIGRLLAAMGRTRVHAPLLDALLNDVGALLPASEAALDAWIAERAGGREHIDLALIERAVRFRESPPPFAVLRRRDLAIVVARHHRDEADRILRLATRETFHRGPTLIEQIAFLAGSRDAPFVARLLGCHAGLMWLDRTGGWFWLRGHRCRLVDAVEEIVSAKGPVPIDDVVDQLAPRWSGLVMPPAKVFRAFCASVPSLEVSGSLVGMAPGPHPDATASLSGSAA